MAPPEAPAAPPRPAAVVPMPVHRPPAPPRALKPLSGRKAIFVAEYQKDFNGRRAVVAAGYSPRSAATQASKMLAEPTIQAAISAALSQRTKKLNLDAEWVLRRLRRVYKMAVAAVPVLDKQGVPTGEYKADLASANRSLELVGKYLKLFTEHVDVTSKGKRIEAPKPAQIMIIAGTRVEF